MQHADHVALIRDGVLGAGHRWLELGAGEGAFTLALADVLGADGHIMAMDRDRWPLTVLADAAAARFPGTPIHTVTADFTRQLPAGPFDGVLAANSLHFVADPRPVLAGIRAILAPEGRLVLVEYDADHGNPYVPHPISYRRWRTLAAEAGFGPPYLLHRVPSRFLGAIYGAAAARGGAPLTGPVGPVIGSVADPEPDPGA
jgi:ubiquinone/menaquinone biosynthesis C-methylase UbiE